MARWILRSDEPSLDEEEEGEEEYNAFSTDAVEEGDFWVRGSSACVDTASVAGGYFAQFTTDGESESGYNATDGFAAVSVDDDNTYVSDIGGGRYEVAASANAGLYWLEIGVVEAGGLWGTFYEDGGVETEGGLEQAHANDEKVPGTKYFHQININILFWCCFRRQWFGGL